METLLDCRARDIGKTGVLPGGADSFRRFLYNASF